MSEEFHIESLVKEIQKVEVKSSDIVIIVCKSGVSARFCGMLSQAATNQLHLNCLVVTEDQFKEMHVVSQTEMYK